MKMNTLDICDAIRRKVEYIFRLYNVGTSHQWNGATIYWYRDILGNYRTGRVMGYDSTKGHRIKKSYVEAEKTCLIAAYLIPEYLWMATGGMKMGFKTEVMKVLAVRDVILFPDHGCYDDLNKHLPLLKPICQLVTSFHYLEVIAADEQREHGFDLGDFLLQEEIKREELARKIQRNPALQLLIDKLDLELIED